MGEVKIYRAKRGKSQVIVSPSEVKGWYHGIDPKSQWSFTDSDKNLTDLTELELHEAGTGVWIEGKSPKEFVRFITSLVNLEWGELRNEDRYFYKSLLAQLSDTGKATEEQVSLGEPKGDCLRMEVRMSKVGCALYESPELNRQDGISGVATNAKDCAVCRKGMMTEEQSDRHWREVHKPDPLASIAESQSEKFFRHLNNGEVYLEVAEMTNGVIEKLRVTIEKGLPA